MPVFTLLSRSPRSLRQWLPLLPRHHVLAKTEPRDGVSSVRRLCFSLVIWSFWASGFWLWNGLCGSWLWSENPHGSTIEHFVDRNWCCKMGNYLCARNLACFWGLRISIGTEPNFNLWMECLDLISGALNCISTYLHHISICLCKFDPCEKSGIGLSEVSSQCKPHVGYSVINKNMKF